MKVSEILKSIRLEHNLTQKDIAKATGTTVPYVCKLERTAFLPSPKFLVRFCRETGASYDFIFKHVFAERMESFRKIMDKRYLKIDKIKRRTRMNEGKIKVKCVCCGFKKEIGKEEGTKLTREKDMPTCDKCFSPMIVEKATIKEKP